MPLFLGPERHSHSERRKTWRALPFLVHPLGLGREKLEAGIPQRDQQRAPSATSGDKDGSTRPYTDKSGPPHIEWSSTHRVVLHTQSGPPQKAPAATEHCLRVEVSPHGCPTHQPPQCCGPLSPPGSWAEARLGLELKSLVLGTISPPHLSPPYVCLPCWTSINSCS